MTIEADFITMRQRVQVECGRTDSIAETWAEIAIAQAINRYRHRQFWFNTAKATLTASVGVAEYDIGTDLVTDSDEVPYDFIRALQLYYTDPSSSTFTGEIKVSDIYAVREMLMAEADMDAPPEIFTFHGNQLIIAPTPDVAYTLTLDYVKDIGTPGGVYSQANSEFRSLDPDDPTSATPAGYTNAWFTHGEEMIRSRAKRIMYSDFLHDPTNASLAAESERIAFQELNGLSLRKKPTIRGEWS